MHEIKACWLQEGDSKHIPVLFQKMMMMVEKMISILPRNYISASPLLYFRCRDIVCKLFVCWLWFFCWSIRQPLTLLYSLLFIAILRSTNGIHERLLIVLKIFRFHQTNEVKDTLSPNSLVWSHSNSFEIEYKTNHKGNDENNTNNYFKRDAKYRHFKFNLLLIICYFRMNGCRNKHRTKH